MLCVNRTNLIMKIQIFSLFLTAISNAFGCRNLIDECVRMESIMSDTTMIQNRTKIYA